MFGASWGAEAISFVLGILAARQGTKFDYVTSGDFQWLELGNGQTLELHALKT